METSITRATNQPAIANSYQRISGGTPTISASNIGPGSPFYPKTKKQSALEDWEAQKAVMEAQEAYRRETDPYYDMKKREIEIAGQAIKSGDYYKRQTPTPESAIRSAEEDARIQQQLKDYNAAYQNKKFQLSGRSPWG